MNDLKRVPASVLQKLNAIRRRSLHLRILDGLLRSVAVLLGVALLAMGLDWMFGWFEPQVRYAITFVALGVAIGAFAWWFLRPLFHRPSMVTTARDIDAALPELEERWSTVTELSQNDDPPAMRGSEAMIAKVIQEAEALQGRILPRTVVPPATLGRASGIFAAVAVLFLLFFALNFSRARVLLQRFYLPGENISLTHLKVEPGNTAVPKGEPITLKAVASGPVRHTASQLRVRKKDGSEKTILISARSDQANSFEHLMPEVNDSFEYRFRAGDGQSAWHRVDALERPRISEVKLHVQPPSYSGLPKEDKTSLPDRLRILQGTELDIAFKSDQPLDKLLLNFDQGVSAPLVAEEGNWYHYRARPTNSTSFTAVLFNKFQLQNKIKPSCRLLVYEDLAPTVSILEPSDDIAVKPDAQLTIAFEAQDDFGVAKADLLVTQQAPGEAEPKTVRIPIDLKQKEGAKEIRQTLQLDLKQFQLKQGDTLAYTIQVSDGKQDPGQAAAGQNVNPSGPAHEQKSEVAQAATAEAKSSDPAADKTDKTEREGAESAQAAGEQAKTNNTELASAEATAQNKSEQDQDAAQGKPGQPGNDGKKGQNGKDGQAGKDGKAGKAGLAAAAEKKVSDDSKSNGNTRPGNDMDKRTLDVAGQAAASPPRSLAIDQWAGSFDGEKRTKQEMAIDPVLKHLDELLAQALEKTESLRQAAATPAGLKEGQSEPLAAARDRLTEGDRAIAELKSLSAGTPYAFIGLQLHNIGEADLTPARRQLAAVSLQADQLKTDQGNLDSGAFHITRAREKLADLTKSYESIKRDKKLAETMQKLNKMYQVFVEDTQPLLGGKKPPINSFERKVAEVDDAYVEKLKEMLEEKKKILAELAKVLAEDPRLLRRYLAMMQLQGTSYRDQMTLLAERQKQAHAQVLAWNAAPAEGRPAIVQQFKQAQAGSQTRVLESATKLHENMNTWLPLDLPPEDPQVKSALEKTEKIIAQLARAGQELASDDPGWGMAASQSALAELRLLPEQIAQIKGSQTNAAKLKAYVASRQEEIEALLAAESAQVKILTSLQATNFAAAAEVVQQRITEDTAALEDKLAAAETQVSSLSPEIAEKAAALNALVRTGILQPQTNTVVKLAQPDLVPAAELQSGIVKAFAQAEDQFDELMQLIIAKSDEAPPPTEPGKAKPLDDLLATLQDELKAKDNLGIPCRPINVTTITDWMRPNSGQAPGQGQAQKPGKANQEMAQAQGEAAKAQAEQLDRQAKEAAQEAVKKYDESPEVADASPGRSNKPGDSWNTLVSKLEKDLLQGRGTTPPEQYQKAIDNYFKIISERVTSDK